MCEITWCVKVAQKCLIAVVLVDVGIPHWTSKVEHIVAFATIFSNICTAHAQKRLFVNFRCKFRHRIHRPRFPFKVQNFSDLATFSVNFCILYAECPPYSYFRFVWPTDLESIPHTSTPTSIISTKFEVDMTIHCRVIAFLSADTSRDFVTWTFDLLTLNSWSTWLVTWSTLRRITRPAIRGSKTITFLESPTPICLFTMQLQCLYDENN